MVLKAILVCLAISTESAVLPDRRSRLPAPSCPRVEIPHHIQELGKPMLL